MKALLASITAAGGTRMSGFGHNDPPGKNANFLVFIDVPI